MFVALLLRWFGGRASENERPPRSLSLPPLFFGGLAALDVAATVVTLRALA